ncbi:hypothetical protein [Thiorhodovibrio frisius]|uniref:Uncharacterized protein n=1 Tax=Thiorhodovibrio frisius TaxID=631362 RepID=H8Z711_9GAMM|nr:hypothetical protein [Thiorhodovibrio frisius]EIC20810.1 hypothetical protein Thi970DRAFT_04473 [Thiorhodovibrio frisius]WPL21861.1 hypothetical protein Thiofri_01998 [Thiorhodovibrio frisius]
MSATKTTWAVRIDADARIPERLAALKQHPDETLASVLERAVTHLEHWLAEDSSDRYSFAAVAARLAALEGRVASLEDQERG